MHFNTLMNTTNLPKITSMTSERSKPSADQQSSTRSQAQASQFSPLTSPSQTNLHQSAMQVAIPVRCAGQSGQISQIKMTDSGFEAQVYFQGGYSKSFPMHTSKGSSLEQAVEQLKAGQFHAEILPSKELQKDICFMSSNGPSKLLGGGFGSSSTPEKKALDKHLAELETLLKESKKTKNQNKAFCSPPAIARAFVTLAELLTKAQAKDVKIKFYNKTFTSKEAYTYALQLDSFNLQAALHNASNLNQNFFNGLIMQGGRNKEIYLQQIASKQFDPEAHLSLALTMTSQESLKLPFSAGHINKAQCLEMAWEQSETRPEPIKSGIRTMVLFSRFYAAQAGDKSLLQAAHMDEKACLIQILTLHPDMPHFYLQLANKLKFNETVRLDRRSFTPIELLKIAQSQGDKIPAGEEKQFKAIIMSLLGGFYLQEAKTRTQNNSLDAIPTAEKERIIMTFKESLENTSDPQTQSAAYAAIGRLMEKKLELVTLNQKPVVMPRQKLLDLAIRLNPDNSLALNTLGRVYGGAELGSQHLSPRECFIRVIVKNPENSEAYRNLASIMRRDEVLYLPDRRKLSAHECLKIADSIDRAQTSSTQTPSSETSSAQPVSAAPPIPPKQPLDPNNVIRNTPRPPSYADTLLADLNRIQDLPAKIQALNTVSADDIAQIRHIKTSISDSEMQNMVQENNQIIQALVAKTPANIPAELKPYYQSMVSAFMHIFTTSSALSTGQFKLNTNISFTLSKAVPVLDGDTCEKIVGTLFAASAGVLDQASTYIPIIGGAFKTAGATGQYLHEEHKYRRLIPFGVLFGHTIQAQIKASLLAEAIVKHHQLQERVKSSLSQAKGMGLYSRSMNAMKLDHKNLGDYSKADAVAIKHMTLLVKGIHQLSKTPEVFEALRQDLQNSASLSQRGLNTFVQMIFNPKEDRAIDPIDESSASSSTASASVQAKGLEKDKGKSKAVASASASASVDQVKALQAQVRQLQNQLNAASINSDIAVGDGDQQQLQMGKRAQTNTKLRSPLDQKDMRLLQVEHQFAEERHARAVLEERVEKLSKQVEKVDGKTQGTFRRFK